MARIKYITKKFKPETLDVIEKANFVCAEYLRGGLSITLRQLYYQFVARGWLANNDRNYKRLGSICADARMAGAMDWDYLIDRTRNLQSPNIWSGPQQILNGAARGYLTDRWALQPTRVQVWIEKDAGIGTIEGVCARNDIPYFSCRGYTSLSEIHAAAQRIRGILEDGKDVRILHIGDHDPSGLDMSRDIEDRLFELIESDQARLAVDEAQRQAIAEGLIVKNIPRPEWITRAREASMKLSAGWGELTVERIALTLGQVEEYNPPPNPAKQTDIRYRRYVEETGLDESWELDALPPDAVQDLIQEKIDEHRDQEAWDLATEEMEDEREVLTKIARRWSDIRRFVEESE